MELSGKVAIVTGGAVRLGRALTLALAEQHVRVVVHHGSSAESAQEVVTQIRSLGGEAIAMQADLRDTHQLADVIKRATDHFGPIDILINNAAIFKPANPIETTAIQWDEHFSINVTAPFFLSQVFAAQVGRDRSAHIINIADWRGVRPDADHAAYSITKAALITMTKTLALTLAPNIQVNAIAPGAILPPVGKDQSYLDDLATKIPLRRSGSPDDVAQAMLYLLRSTFVTGELMFVTGGQHL
jgi:NAD(P)-dependent dehydrogenase (short-subunit alcohol dehydrogenase family)